MKLDTSEMKKGISDYFNSVTLEEFISDLAETDPIIKPYSKEDYEDAKQQGLDLDNWNDYKRYCRMEEFADEE